MTNSGGTSRFITGKMKGAPGAPTAIWILSFVICHSAAVALALAFAVGTSAVAFGSEAAAEGGAGRIIYVFRDALWSANPDGTGARPITRGMPVYAYDVAPGGARVAFAVGTWRGDRKKRELVESGVWVVNADGAGLRKLAGPSKVHGPLKRVGHLHWSPDGRFIAFDVPGGQSARAGGGALFAIHLPDGALRAVAREPVQTFEWTPDGQIRYRPANPGDDGHAEWLVSPVGAPRPRVASPEPAAAAPASHAAAPPAGAFGSPAGREVVAAPPPLPPGAIPAPQPSSPPSSPPTPTGRLPLEGSGPGAD